MTKILGIIPARAGSKRLPNKNKLIFNGKPLIQNIMESAQNSKLLDYLVISTDDKDILKMSDDYPGIQFINRPEDLATDDSPSIDYVNHTIEILEKANKLVDIIVILQPSSPLTLSEDIDNTIKLLLNSKDADSSVSVVKLDHAIHPFKMKIFRNQVLLPFIEEEKGRMAEKDLPDIFVRNCSVYVTKRSVVKSGKIIGDKCLGYIMPRERSIDINDQVDFAFAEFLNRRS